VYDQQCYSPEDAAITVEILKGRVGRYVLCSTAAVYDRSLIDAGEELFDPISYPIRFPGREAVDYGEGKRLSEAVLFQRGTFSTVSVRLPVIIGPDDYTERLRVQVRRVAAGEPLKVLNPEAKVGLVSSGEAAAFFAWLSLVDFTGPFNACSKGTIALREIVGLIEEATGKTATVLAQSDEGSFSMFFARKSFNISSARAQSCGFTFLGILDWLPSLVHEEAGLCR
jgi:nucleoside-diphosphate-sugar epimerase